MLALLAVGPVVGALAEPLGRRFVFVLAAATLALGTLWCALAGSMLAFVPARTVTGAGVGGLVLAGDILSSDVVPVE